MQTVEDGESDLVVPGPEQLRAHHIVCKYIQTQLKTLGVDVGSFGDTPVKVFTDEAHYGAGLNSLHNKMNAWKQGALSPSSVAQYTDKTKLIDNLIQFYVENQFGDMAKVVRGRASQHNIPYTK